jgi:hypothetical protein
MKTKAIPVNATPLRSELDLVTVRQRARQIGHSVRTRDRQRPVTRHANGASRRARADVRRENGIDPARDGVER